MREVPGLNARALAPSGTILAGVMNMIMAIGQEITLFDTRHVKQKTGVWVFEKNNTSPIETPSVTLMRPSIKNPPIGIPYLL